MRKMLEKLKTLCVLLLGLLLVACSGDDDSSAWRTYPDAVVNINQVDPAYRAYFRSQHGANYSLRDQREAFIAATRTARTPVPKYVPQPAAAPQKKNKASRGKATARGKGKSRGRGKTKAATKKKDKANKGKGKAGRKSTKRRR